MTSPTTPEVITDAGQAGDEHFALETTTPRPVHSLAIVLALVVLGGTTDLVLDRPASWWSVHVTFELGLIALSLATALVLWRGWWRTAHALGHSRRMLATTRQTLAERQAERDAWLRQAEVERAGFGRAIDAQFAVWRLTPTERDVAFRLLQGLGHKQIAARTGRSERTVRQHAVSVYEKSGLGGRAELAAFFLHDLLPATSSQRSGEPA